MLTTSVGFGEAGRDGLVFFAATFFFEAGFAVLTAFFFAAFAVLTTTTSPNLGWTSDAGSVRRRHVPG
jgi:hypothetical protein